MIRFKLAADGETAYDWTATFSEDCNAIVLRYSKPGMARIHFTRARPKR